jgi:hypothetical protein
MTGQQIPHRRDGCNCGRSHRYAGMTAHSSGDCAVPLRPGASLQAIKAALGDVQKAVDRLRETQEQAARERFRSEALAAVDRMLAEAPQ